jgi:hypothetical protein
MFFKKALTFFPKELIKALKTHFLAQFDLSKFVHLFLYFYQIHRSGANILQESLVVHTLWSIYKIAKI